MLALWGNEARGWPDYPISNNLELTVSAAEIAPLSEPSTVEAVAVAGPSNLQVAPAVLNIAVDSCKSSPVTVAEITPIPRRIKKIKHIRKKGSSQILTSTLIKEQLIEKSSTKEKKAKNIVEKKKILKAKKKVFSSSSSNTSAEVELDDEGLRDQDSTDDEICILCGDFGKDRETWFRCTLCGKWAHKECSGVEKAKSYICDYCKLN